MKPPIFDPAWPADVQALYRHDMREIWDPTIAPQIWNQYHSQLDLYCGLAGGSRGLDILDVGCAQGTLALLMAERGHRVCAMDIRQQFLDYAVTRHERGVVQFLCGNAMDADPGRQFDLIFANQLVEHLVYPAQLVARLARWLKPRGRLVVTTPNGSYVKNPLPSFGEVGDPAQLEHLQFSADGDGHFFAYRAEELVAIVQGVGLSNVRVQFFETPWISGHMKFRYLHGWIPSRVLRSLDALTLKVPVLSQRLAHQLMIIGVAA
jgi:2-polyprenyl-3-methyl-5-hydroxy-6-metoxy-1,4-benzoquinol methylase